ncbi:hypothetical protein HJC23_009676 [Cyclotella cryptica]|uniref:Probable cytosolic iron-sulfur protein assembly protein CIAO1 homolog n=1 Tax=Cyclotella cryptica TaxID=29204 RepID=A0ABD3QEI3_9STRA|eukprot:CCRYP_007622-RA/>CCRYP_007622-RA protein AED:0.02 eAED:0.02 QI:60/1/1/1/1/1/2/240/463
MTDLASAPPKPHLSLQQTLSLPNLTSSPAWSASFSLDANFLAVCFGNPGTHIKIWRHLKDITNIGGVSDNGEEINGKGKDTNKKGGQWKPFATIREGHARTIRHVAFAPLPASGGVLILASASFDGKVMIWECSVDDDDTANLEDTENVDDGERETGGFEAIAQLEGHENEVKHLAWNQTGSLLASCGRDKTVWIWECFLPGTVGGFAASSNVKGSAAMQMEQDDGEFECLAVLQGHDGDVKSIAFAPSHGQWGEGEEILLSASYDGSIKVWAEESGDWYCAATLGLNSAIPRSVSTLEDSSNKQQGTVHPSTIWCLGVTPGGVRFLSGSEDGSIAIWKMYTSSERKQLFPREHAMSSTDGFWNCVGVLPDAHSGYAVLSIDCAPSRAGHGRIVSGGGDNSIHIYREQSGVSSSDAPKFSMDVVTHYAHDGDINCVKWHPVDGMSLVSCGDDGAVKLWRYVQG